MALLLPCSVGFEMRRCEAKEYRQTAAFKASQKKHRTKARLRDPHKVWFTSLEARAKLKGIEVTIAPCDVPWPAKCPVLGIPIEVVYGHANDHSPSCDRIHPEDGYVPGNVQVISQRANRLKDNVTNPNEIADVAAYVASHFSLLELCEMAKVA